MLVVRRRHALLQFDRAGDRVDRTGELDQHAVAHDLDDAAVMLGDQRIQDALTPLLQRRQRARLVLLHQSAVADHVGGKDGGEAALDAFFGHVARLLQRTQCARLYWCPVEESIGPDFRCGSCVTSIAGPNGGAQLYER